MEASQIGLRQLFAASAGSWHAAPNRSHPRPQKQRRTAHPDHPPWHAPNQGRLFDRVVMSRHRVESELRHRRIPHPLQHPLRARHFIFDAGKLLAEPLRTKPTCGACGAERNQLRQHTKTPLSPRDKGANATSQIVPRSLLLRWLRLRRPQYSSPQVLPWKHLGRTVLLE